MVMWEDNKDLLQGPLGKDIWISVNGNDHDFLLFILSIFEALFEFRLRPCSVHIAGWWRAYEQECFALQIAIYVGPEWVTASFVRSLLLTIFMSLITEGINLCLDPFLYEITKTLFPMLIFRREKSMLGINWKWRVVCISLRMKKFTYFAWCRLGFTLPISNLFMYFTFKLVKVFNFFS